MEKRWLYNEAPAETVGILCEKLHISTVLATAMVNRGITDPAAGNRFLYDTVESLADPFLLSGTEKAVPRILDALAKGEKIVVYGDYDVDGITSTALVYQILSDLGGDPVFYIPERQTEGYGLNREALEELIKERTDLIITVDCGISSVELIEEFKDKTDIIITDHHEPSDRIPDAYAVLNPKKPGCAYPCKELAGVGVAYTLCRALWRERYKENLVGYTALVALGTVADLVPLTGENRVLVADGLTKIADGCSCGLQALAEVSGIDAAQVTAGNIAFSLAPRLNAAGRISHAEKGVFLLLEKDPLKARETALELHELNKERQDIEKAITQAAVDEIEKNMYSDDNVLIAVGEGWHSGVIGIAASRLVERYYRPSLVIIVKDGIGKGSCRSIKGFSMYEALTYCKDLLIRFGGHAMAAGFTVLPENIDELRRQMNEYAAGVLREDDYIPVLNVDAVLDGHEVTVDTVRELCLLEPYGMGNGRPLFALRQARVYDIKEIGRDKSHIRLALDSADGTRVNGVGWSMADLAGHILPDDEIDVAFQLHVNTFRELTEAQMILQDVHFHTDDIRLNRETMVRVYKKLREYLSQRPRQVRLVRRHLLEALPDFPGHVLLAALQVCRELQLIETVCREDDIYYEMPARTEKLSLADSRTFRLYNGK